MKRKLNIVFLLICSLGYLLIAFKAGQSVLKLVKKEPMVEKYNTDMNCYLKTYYLIEKGIPFYQAYALGEIGDSGSDSYPGEIWGWKTPFLFYLWKLFPGTDGRTVYWLFLSLVFTTPLAAFLIGEKLMGEKYAFLSPFLLWPYFILPLKEITFIQVEWWGLIFFLWGFYFLLKEKFFWTGLFFTFCLFSRELFSIHLFSFLLVFLFRKKTLEKKNIKKAIFSILIPFFLIVSFYLLVHIPQVGRYENLSNFNNWTRAEVKKISLIGIQKTLAFNSANYYYLVRFFPFRISLLGSTFSLIYLYWRKRKITYLLFLACFLPFFIFQIKPGLMTVYHDYWGIYYVPFTLISLPSIVFLIGFVLGKRKK